MDRIYKIYKDKSTLAIKGELLYAKELNFDAVHPIEAHPIYETEQIKKVYWTDGKNQPRVINIEASTEDKAKWDETTFDFVRVQNLQELVTVTKVPLGNGLFPAGTIQYVFSYYNKYRQQSNIFHTSPLYYNTFVDRAGSPDEVVSNSYNIEIKSFDHRFDYVRVYSIVRTSLDGTPIVKRLIDLIIGPVVNPLTDTLKFTDDNRIGDIIDPMELLYIGGEPISVGTMVSKDNTLFLGNIDLIRKEVGQSISDSFRSGDNSAIDEVSVKLYTENSSNSQYNYKPQFTESKRDLTTFKSGEVYRFGLQFQHETGKWSEAVWIEDKLINKPPDINNHNVPIEPILFNGTSVDINGIKCQYTIPETQATLLRALGYRRVRGLVVYPSVQDRNILCQGVINPTLYNINDRATKSPYAISSWYFRPMIKQTVIDDYSKGVSLEYQHGEVLPYNKYRNSEIQLMREPTETVTPRGNTQSYVIQDNSTKYGAFYMIDQSIQTFHSPDLEFDSELSQLDDSNNLKLRIIGLTAFTGFASNSNLSTSTGLTNPSNQGWIKPNIGTFNYDNQYGVNALVNHPSFNDEDAYFVIYPWQSIRSLNSKESSDSRPAMLAKKNMLNYRYSGYNLYIDNIILRTSSVNFFNTKEYNTTKLKSVLGYDVSDLNYQGNVDKILTPNEDNYYIQALSLYTLNNPSYSGNTWLGTESTRIQFNSSPHLVIPLDWSSSVDTISNVEEVTVTTGEHIVDLLNTDNIPLYTKFKVNGPINNLDIQFIRDMTNLQELDLTNAVFTQDDSNGYETYNFDGELIVEKISETNHIGMYTFAGLNITKVTLPTSLIAIEPDAFCKCTKLTSILNIPVGLTSIGSRAFWGCESLTSLTFPNFTDQMSISNSAFTNCSKLHSITSECGEYLRIYVGAFNNCNALSFMYCKNTTSSPQMTYNSFSNFSKMIIVTKDTDYTSHMSTLISRLQYNILPEDGTHLYTKLIAGTVGTRLETTLGTVTYSNWESSIAAYIHHLTVTGYINTSDFEYLHNVVREFYNMFGGSIQVFKNLRKLDLSGITTLGSGSLYGHCLQRLPFIEVILPAKIGLEYNNTIIYGSAFIGCTNLQSISIPKSISCIKAEAFKDCTSLTEIIIEDRGTATDLEYSTLQIDKLAFEGCPIKYVKCLDSILPQVIEMSTDAVPVVLDSSMIRSNLSNSVVILKSGTKQYLETNGGRESKAAGMWVYDNIIESASDTTKNIIYKMQTIPPDLGNPTEGFGYINSFRTHTQIKYHRPASPYNQTNLECNGGLWLAEVYRDNVDISNRFGGTTPEALEANVWIPAGPTVPLAAGSIIKYLEGDTYIQRYDCLKTYPSNKDDMQTMAETLSFLCETRVNLDARYDTNRGKTGNLLPSPSNFNLMNPTYNQKNNYFNYRTLDYSKFNMDTFPNTFTWTKTKIAGELIDAWTNITMASTLDANGDYGSLKAFKIYNNEIYGFQDNAFFNVIFNSRVMIPTSDNAGIELTNNYKVEGTRYVSTTAGTRNKWGIKETPNGLYFIDDVSKSINVFNGKLNNLTDTLGFHSWVVDSIKDTTSWTPYAYNNFTTHYDCIDNNVYFVNDKHCLCYNETLGTFTSFFSYEGIPFMFNVWDNFIAVGKYLQTSETVDNVEVVTKSFNLWDQNKGDYNVFFGKHRPYYTQIIMNDEPRMDKIFNTLDFRSDTWSVEWSDRKLNRVPAIPSNICGFDLLEAQNEYQYGKTNLTSEGRNTRDAVRRFRVWRTNIPRNNSQLGSTYKERMDRMRNTWLYIKLYSDGLNTNETVLHDLVVHYTV